MGMCQCYCTTKGGYLRSGANSVLHILAANDVMVEVNTDGESKCYNLIMVVVRRTFLVSQHDSEFVLLLARLLCFARPCLVPNTLE